MSDKSNDIELRVGQIVQDESGKRSKIIRLSALGVGLEDPDTLEKHSMNAEWLCDMIRAGRVRIVKDGPVLKVGQVWEGPSGCRRQIFRIDGGIVRYMCTYDCMYDDSAEPLRLNVDTFVECIGLWDWRLLDGANTKPWTGKPSTQPDRAALIRAKLAELEAKRGRQAVTTPWNPEEL